MTIVLLALTLGVLLANVLPRGGTAPVYAKLTEEDFQRMLAKRGLR
jgi:hypothetical protein